MKFILSLCLLLFMTSCSSTYQHDYAVMGADEFVMDSYRIRQGKMAILELEGKELVEITAQDLEEYQDVVAEEDILSIILYHPSRKDLMEAFRFINESVGFKIKNGMITLPDMLPLKVSGLTLDETREQLLDKLREQIVDVDLFISYRDRLKRKVELTGLVSIPAIPVDGKMRLYEVLSKAHLPPGANLFMSYVLRNGCHLAIDMHQLLNEGDLCQNIVMREGDKIFIAYPSDSTVMLMGEVRSPRAVNLPYGFMSLREALVSVGGIPFTGDKHHIQVIRGNMVSPKIYVLAWEHIIHLPNDSLLLMPGDTVYVSETAITSWNRFIEQLLPSFSGFQTGYGAYRLITD